MADKSPRSEADGHALPWVRNALCLPRPCTPSKDIKQNKNLSIYIRQPPGERSCHVRTPCWWWKQQQFRVPTGTKLCWESTKWLLVYSLHAVKLSLWKVRWWGACHAASVRADPNKVVCDTPIACEAGFNDGSFSFPSETLALCAFHFASQCYLRLRCLNNHTRTHTVGVKSCRWCKKVAEHAETKQKTGKRGK